MKSFSTMFKTELKITVRHGDNIFFGILFPLGMVLLLGAIYGSQPAFQGAGYSKLQLAFGAFISIGICATGLMGLPLVLADYRHRKILKRFKVTPVSPAKLLVIQVAICFIIAIISALASALAAKLFFGYAMPGSIPRFIGAYLLVTAAIYSLGMFIASVVPSVKMANLVCTIVYFPMLFLSGATVPYEIMPKALQKVSDILPLTQGIKLLKGVSLGEPINNFTLQFILMVVIGIICIVASIKFFKWE